jgi:Homeodomain-like domain
MLLEGFGPGRACALGSNSPQMVDLDSSEVKLFEAVLAWKRSHPRPLTTLSELVDPMFDYGTITTLRQPQVRLDKAQRQQVADQYRAGIAVKDIAAAFGVHRKTVREIAIEAGLGPHPRGLQPKDVERATRLYRSGWSLARVGAEFAVDASTVMNALKREGVEMRPRQGGRHRQIRPAIC